mmetsp:Transcript_22138/g.39259  ORF Transcript_22138/g.39259 Transcript_22138/m.39259 type:complete len:392 (+) Transcript_22138:75-1250(+)
MSAFAASTEASVAKIGANTDAATQSGSSGQDAATQEKPFQVGLDKGLGDIVVRVKRKRMAEDEAPNVLLLPQKKSRRGQSLEAVLAQMSMTNEKQAAAQGSSQSPDEDKLVLVCSLADHDKKEPGKRGLDCLDEDTEEQAEKLATPLKRPRRTVDVERAQSGELVRRVASSAPNAQMDFAIWHGMTSGDMVVLQGLLLDPLCDVNYQRHVDGVTALMAAASHCDLAFVDDLLKRGADIAIEDTSGFDASAHAGFNVNAKSQELVQQVLTLLAQSTYVYDTYVVSGLVPLRDIHTAQAPSAVWTDNGMPTAWHDAPIVNFELDVDALLGEDDLVVETERDSVNESDLENEDDENYKYNDYPDEEDEDEDDDDFGETASEDSDDKFGGGRGRY